MAEEEELVDVDLDYLEEKDKEYKSVRGPLAVARVKLFNQHDSRVNILQKMEQIYESFNEEILKQSFLKGMPIIDMFNRFLELYDEYKVIWEETIETYNDAFRDVVDTIDNYYTINTGIGVKERKKIMDLKIENSILKRKGKKIRLEYRNKLNVHLLEKEEFISLFNQMIKQNQEDGKIEVDFIKDIVNEWCSEIKEIRKNVKHEVTLIDDDDTEINKYFEKIKSAKKPNLQYTSLMGVLKRKVKGKKISETEYQYKKTALRKAYEMYKTSLQFKPETKTSDEIVDEEEMKEEEKINEEYG